MLDYYGPQLGLLRFRKHLTRYLRPMSIPADCYGEFLTCDDASALVSLLEAAILDPVTGPVPVGDLAE